jgi:DNA-binding NarL/FixJ family response regulator
VSTAEQPPLGPAVVDPAPDLEAPRQEPGDSVTVLVVDDQAPFRAAARTLVERTPGFRVVGDADSAERALELLDALRPALLLMDVRLPGMTGVEATRLVRSRRPGTVVLLCSTYERADLPADLDECGAAGYVRKEQLSPAVLRRAWDRRPGVGSPAGRLVDP